MNIRGERVNSEPCEKCGCTERYAITGYCPKCHLRKAKYYRDKNRAIYREKSRARNKRVSDKKAYGVVQDPVKTAMRRAIEDRQAMKKEELCSY